jgi:hypothetical protein
MVASQQTRKAGGELVRKQFPFGDKMESRSYSDLEKAKMKQMHTKKLFVKGYKNDGIITPSHLTSLAKDKCLTLRITRPVILTSAGRSK